MEQFILQSENVILNDNRVNVRLFPVNLELINIIDTHKTYENLTDANSDLSSFIAEMTPILYENLNPETKSNYYL
jgi:hypothetical protein